MKTYFVRSFSWAMLFLPFCSVARGGDSTEKKQAIFYRLTVGAGIPTGFDISGLFELAVEKNRSVYSAGYRDFSDIDFELLSQFNVYPELSSIEFTYGKSFRQKNIAITGSAGISFLRSIARGELLTREGGWLGSSYTYEVIKKHGIGFPVSGKFIFAMRNYYGIGLELFANVNGISSYGGFNIDFYFENLRGSKRRNN